jgi:hypothetical protein
MSRVTITKWPGRASRLVRFWLNFQFGGSRLFLPHCQSCEFRGTGISFAASGQKSGFAVFAATIFAPHQTDARNVDNPTEKTNNFNLNHYTNLAKLHNSESGTIWRNESLSPMAIQWAYGAGIAFLCGNSRTVDSELYISRGRMGHISSQQMAGMWIQSIRASRQIHDPLDWKYRDLDGYELLQYASQSIGLWFQPLARRSSRIRQK